MSYSLGPPSEALICAAGEETKRKESKKSRVVDLVFGHKKVITYKSGLGREERPKAENFRKAREWIIPLPSFELGNIYRPMQMDNYTE